MGPKRKNNNARNAYWYYVQDQKKELQRQGIRWQNNNELFEMCNASWNSLPANQKARYDTDNNIYPLAE